MKDAGAQTPTTTLDGFLFFYLEFPEMHSRLCGELGTAACEGLKVRTMHRGRRRRDEYQERRSHRGFLGCNAM